MNISTVFFALLIMAVFSLSGGCAKPHVSPLISDFAENYYQRSYLCPDGTLFLVEADGNNARVLLGAREWSLQRTVSASGEKYQGERNLYWNRGDVALFEVDHKLYLNCSGEMLSQPRQQARQRGTLIRAVGQEPGWVVEITAAGTLILTDYGQNRHELSAPTVLQGTRGESVRYLIADHPQRIELTVTKTTCQDTMSGEAYPARAELIIGDQSLTGCADVSADTFN